MFDFLLDVLDLLDDLSFTTDSDEVERKEQAARIIVEREKAKAAELKRVIEEGKWLCECGCVNIKHAAECSSCGKWKFSCQANIPAMLEAIEERIAQHAAPVVTAEPFVTTELVETADGKWICGCGYKNRKHAVECSACGNSKPLPQVNKTVVQEVPEEGTAQPSEPVGTNVDTPAGVSAKGMWFCGKCGSYNEDTALCKDCGTAKE